MKDNRRVARKPNLSGKQTMSYRKLAGELNLSPSHICRVINGERQSRRLIAELKKRGIKCRKAI